MFKKNNTNVKKMNYTVTDANLSFLYALIVPVAVSLLFVVSLFVVAAIFNTTYDVLIGTSIVNYITLMLMPAIFFGIYYVYNKRRNIVWKAASKLRFQIEPFRVVVVLLISAVSIYLLAPFISLTEHLFTFIGFAPSNELPLAFNSGWDFLIGVFIMAVLPAVTEELLFRGIMLNGLNSKLSENRAVIFSALMFMLIHGSLQQTVYQFILGVLLGYTFIKTKNLLYPILLHFFNNFIVVVSAYLYTQSGATQTTTTAAFATAVDYYMPVVLAIIGAGLLYWLLNMLNQSSLLKYLSRKPNQKNNNNTKHASMMVVNQTETTETGNQAVLIEVSQKPLKLKNCLPYEKKLFAFAVGLGVVLWLINTISTILGI